MKIQRRTLLELALIQAASTQSAAASSPLPATFPTQAPELAREMVSVSHGNVKRVREMVTAQPSLARASWDWGFGDWETALGAASHVGNREIALFLIENGAPPTLFSAAMLGQLEVVKAVIAANPNAQRIPGPHSISLLLHARSGGEAAKPVFQYLESFGDAGDRPVEPISPEEVASISGTYSFGPSQNDRIEIAAVKGNLQFTRAGSDARRLFHLGNLAFHPAGARAVRIVFDGKGALTVSDPGPVFTARKM